MRHSALLFASVISIGLAACGGSTNDQSRQADYDHHESIHAIETQKEKFEDRIDGSAVLHMKSSSVTMELAKPSVGVVE